MTGNTQVLIDSLPRGKLEAHHYRLHTAEVPTVQEGEVLVKTRAFCVLPRVRVRVCRAARVMRVPRKPVLL